MRLPSLMRVPKHRRFEFTPRFHDPIREDLQQRESRIRAELTGKQDPNYRPDFRGAFGEARAHEGNQHKRVFATRALIFGLLICGVLLWYAGSIWVLLVFPIGIIALYIQKRQAAGNKQAERQAEDTSSTVKRWASFLFLPAYTPWQRLNLLKRKRSKSKFG